MNSCVHCREPVARGAMKCPHCGAALGAVLYLQGVAGVAIIGLVALFVVTWISVN